MKIIPHTPYKVQKIDFPPCNKSIMAIKILSTNLEQL